MNCEELPEGYNDILTKTVGWKEVINVLYDFVKFLCPFKLLPKGTGPVPQSGLPTLDAEKWLFS